VPVSLVEKDSLLICGDTFEGMGVARVFDVGNTSTCNLEAFGRRYRATSLEHKVMFNLVLHHRFDHLDLCKRSGVYFHRIL